MRFVGLRSESIEPKARPHKLCIDRPEADSKIIAEGGDEGIRNAGSDDMWEYVSGINRLRMGTGVFFLGKYFKAIRASMVHLISVLAQLYEGVKTND
jgi:hypothetical protein